MTDLLRFADPVAGIQDCLPGVPGELGYFPLMSLATVDRDGCPDVRSVLLSEILDGALYFHTDADSRKVGQLLAHPRAALCVVLPEMPLQIVVVGAVSVAPAVERDRAYGKRSRYLQLLAWLNTPEAAELPESEQRRRWSAFDQAHPDGSLDPPGGWIGFAVVPDRITFWQAAADRPSRRTEYARSGDGWTVSILPG